MLPFNGQQQKIIKNPSVEGNCFASGLLAFNHNHLHINKRPKCKLKTFLCVDRPGMGHVVCFWLLKKAKSGLMLHRHMHDPSSATDNKIHDTKVAQMYIAQKYNNVSIHIELELCFYIVRKFAILRVHNLILFFKYYLTPKYIGQ